jgi:hypothetical protein
MRATKVPSHVKHWWNFPSEKFLGDGYGAYEGKPNKGDLRMPSRKRIILLETRKTSIQDVGKHH